MAEQLGSQAGVHEGLEWFWYDPRSSVLADEAPISVQA